MKEVKDNVTILVIDDEDSMRNTCCQVLNREGYRTENAKDGDSGLYNIKKMKPDLVLIDLKMPGMNGMELLGRIKEIDPNIIPIVITGYATIELAVEAMKKNAYDLLTKPFTPDQLRSITKRALEKRRAILESEYLKAEKDKIKENFITLVSHQLRSPLIAIQQYFKVILAGFVGKAAGKQKVMMENASKRIEELINLINNWLNMSNIKNNKFINNFEPVDLASVISQSIEILRPLAEKRKVALFKYIPEKFLIIKGNKEALKQAFINFLSNGIYYNCSDGGVVTVVGGFRNNFCVVEIADTGIGISQEDLPFIFDEFFRVKNGETQNITGSGLGLPIAKRIIEEHNGAIKVDSEIGKGTTLSIIFPKEKLIK